MPYYAHRLSLALALGIDYDNLDGVVRHLCHNRLCVNPLHLALGTQAINLQEAAALGRSHWTKAQRDSHGRFMTKEPDPFDRAEESMERIV